MIQSGSGVPRYGNFHRSDLSAPSKANELARLGRMAWWESGSSLFGWAVRVLRVHHIRPISHESWSVQLCPQGVGLHTSGHIATRKAMRGFIYRSHFSLSPLLPFSRSFDQSKQASSSVTLRLFLTSPTALQGSLLPC